MILEWREEKAKGVLERRYGSGIRDVRGVVGGGGQHWLLAGCYLHVRSVASRHGSEERFPRIVEARGDERRGGRKGNAVDHWR